MSSDKSKSHITEKFIPVPTPDTLPFWSAAREGRLVLPHCTACGPFFYPRSHCPNCGSGGILWFEASGRATLYSYVVNYAAAAPGYEGELPYVVAIVQLEEGPRMMANILGDFAVEKLELDMPLCVIFEQRGDVAIPQFTLAETAR